MARIAADTQPLVLYAGSGNIRSLATHTNPGLEIVYVDKGHLFWQVEGRLEVVPPRSIFFTLPWQRHGSTEEFEPGHHWHFVILRLVKRDLSRPGHFDFPPAYCFSRPQSARLVSLLLGARRHAYPASTLLASVVPALVRAARENGPLQERAVAALATTALLELAAAIEGGGADPGRPAAPAYDRIARLLDEVSRLCEEPWTLASMADLCGLRRSRFADLLREQTGDSPIRLLNRLRIARARRLLRDTNASVTEIAFRCGYSSSQYFAEMFRRFTGQTPTAYRKPPV